MVNHSSPHRRNIRLPEFDYSQPGDYFVTIVTQDRKPMFGKVVDSDVVLSALGSMVAKLWAAIPEHSPNVEMGIFVVMPNHIHGVISITVEARHAVPLPQGGIERFGKPISGSLPTIVRSFKSASTKKFHEFSEHSGERLWQRGYYDHVIRNEKDYQAIYDYILTNPYNWEKDEEFVNL